MPTEFHTLLQSLGCRTPAETCVRFGDDVDFYTDVTTEMLRDPCFEALGAQLKAGNLAAAFNEAHTLKGIIGNCGITPLYDLIVKIVEPLRAPHAGQVDLREMETLYGQLLQVRDVTAEKLRECAAAQ